MSWPTTADAVVSVPEIFNYWLQPGRIDVGFLGAAQLDKFGNINTTVIGPDYAHPTVRLPGAGGAPEIAASCGEVFVVLRQSRADVRGPGRLHHLGRATATGPGHRERLGLRGRGPDAGHHRPRRARARPGDLRADPDRAAPRRRASTAVRAATGWDLAVAADRTGERGTDRPSELTVLRQLTSPRTEPVTMSVMAG